MPAKRERGVRGTSSRAGSEQPEEVSHGNVSRGTQEDVNTTTRRFGNLAISHDRRRGVDDVEVEGTTRGVQNMTLGQQRQQGTGMIQTALGLPMQNSNLGQARTARTALEQPMQSLNLADDDDWQSVSHISRSTSADSSQNAEEPFVRQEHVHIYHHESGVAGPTHTIEGVATVGEASQLSVDQGWHRFTYPLGLKEKEEPAFLLALESLLRTKYMKGLPRIKKSTVKRRKFIDVCRLDCSLRPGRDLNEIKVEVKVGAGAATRIKELTVYSHEYNAGLGPHLARIDVRDYVPDDDLEAEAKSQAIHIVECLDERLRQAKVLDAWIGMTISSDGDEVWNGGLVILVALYADVGLTTPTRSRKKVLKMQHGYLEVEGEQLKLSYPHRRFWCIYCKGSLPFERFHIIQDCPSTWCLHCPDAKRHRNMRCPDYTRNRRPPVAR